MQRLKVLFAVMLVAGVMALVATGKDKANGEGESKDKKVDPKTKAAASVDVTKEMRELNKKSSPTTKYRKGHVKPRKLDGKALTKTDDGWQLKLPGNFPIPTPAVKDGRLYVSGGFGSKQYYCVDAATGKFIWGADLDDDGPTSAVIEDGVCVFNTESCTIFACDAKTGKMLWSYWLGDPLTTTPAIANGLVYTTYPANGQGGHAQQLNNNVQVKPDNNAQVQQNNIQVRRGGKTPASHIMGCFELKTGKIVWQKWVDGDAMSAPIVADKEVFITTFPGTVFKFDAKTGKILSAVRARATAAPTVVGNEVFFTKRADTKGKPVAEAISNNDRGKLGMVDLYASRSAKYLDSKVQARSAMAKKGAKLDAGNGFGSAPAASGYQYAQSNVGQGRVATMQAFQGSRILNWNGRNYNCMGDELVCTNPKTKKKEWSVKLKGDLKKIGGFLGSPPAMAGGKLIMSTYDGRVLQIDPKAGEIEKEYKVKAAIRFQPTVVNGRIYVGTQDGRVICINTKDKSLTGWPMWGGNAAHTGKPVK